MIKKLLENRDYSVLIHRDIMADLSILIADENRVTAESSETMLRTQHAKLKEVSPKVL